MPLLYKIRRGLLTFTMKGDVEYAQGLEIGRQAFDEVRKSSTAGEPLWNVVIDLRESTEERTSDELQGMAMALAQYTNLFTGRVAVVALEPEHLQRVANFSVFSEKLGYVPQVFGDVAAAEAWLKS